MTEARKSAFVVVPLVLFLAASLPALARAANPEPGPPITIQRAAGPITLDGDLSDPGWQGLTPITKWYETNVGDNVEPQVKNLAYLTYDDKFLYAGFQFEDPAPKGVRAPIGDHDAMPGSTDYAGVIVDTRNDGKTAQMFLANLNGVQYDAVTSDATGEDNSPDFFWDCVGKTTATGWNLEIRIPFSSLRYSTAAQPTMGILLYRNYPRDRRYQFFTSRLPRDVNCFICNSAKMVGLQNLPKGSHLVLAPYATASQSSEPENGLGTPLTPMTGEGVLGQAGLDVKWAPSSAVVMDATYNPDFSQIESDQAQISANERFALFFSEKRPFFLEGVDLLSTPITAVYTRTITDPRGGLRTTGKVGNTAYTALGTFDEGGGLTILPGPQGSDFALQDFRSGVGLARMRRDMGRSFVSLLATGRVIEGNEGSNFVFGPDFQWRPRGSDSFTGQALWSQSQTPNRPDLATEWNGQKLSDHALLAYWSHSTEKVDWYFQGQEYGNEFRADDGFVPQVGYREIYGEAGYTIRPKDFFFSRMRFFSANYYDADVSAGDHLAQRLSVGIGADGKWNSFWRIELNNDNALVGTDWLQRFRPHLVFQMSPTRAFNLFVLDSYVGEEIDFANAREGTGATIATTLLLRPNDHLELRGNGSVRWLDDDAGFGKSRVFTAQVERLRAVWAFNAKSFIRLIGQYQQTTRDPAMYTFPVDVKNADFGGSALFAYKLNWQTVLYAGYGDNRTFYPVTDQLERLGRSVFMKVSYAYQQ